MIGVQSTAFSRSNVSFPVLRIIHSKGPPMKSNNLLLLMIILCSLSATALDREIKSIKVKKADHACWYPRLIF
jgi:hypothetical protein